MHDSSRAQRVDDLQKAKAMEIRTAGQDSGESVFAHQRCGMQIPHPVAARLRNFAQAWKSVKYPTTGFQEQPMRRCDTRLRRFVDLQPIDTTLALVIGYSIRTDDRLPG